MSSTALFRLSGLALLIALPLQMIGLLIHPPGEEIEHVLESTYAPAHLIVVGAWLLILLGLPGLYAYQAERAGALGLVSFALMMALAAYHFYLALYETFATPRLAEDTATRSLVGPGGDLSHGVQAAATLFMPLIIAIPLFGFASLRSRVFPRWSAWLQIAAVPVWLLSAVLYSLLPTSLEDALMAPINLGPVTLFYSVLTLGYAISGHVLWTSTGEERAARARRTSLQSAS
jgi:phosphoglycerol transferase MdoB-like AlkP superfamily enzyme